jgi:hypothetical protein
MSRLLDQLVGCGEQRLRYAQAERLCGLEIENQLILGRRLHRHVGWLLALENAIEISRGSPDRIERVRSQKNLPAEVEYRTFVSPAPFNVVA